MTAVEISDEDVSRADYSRRAQPFEPAHGPQSGFQAAVRCTVRTFTGRCRARYVVPHACHKRGQQRSMEVTPDHSWPQAKACSRASLEGSQAPDQHRCLRWAFAPGWPPGLGLGSGGGHQSAGIPSRRRQRHSGPGAGGLCRSAAGCSTWTAVPGPLRGKLADATGYPLPAFISCGKERRPYGYPTFT
jgi:hypothetical protein